jgi:outer membrane biosynthesis protein TonB
MPIYKTGLSGVGKYMAEDGKIELPVGNWYAPLIACGQLVPYRPEDEIVNTSPAIAEPEPVVVEPPAPAPPVEPEKAKQPAPEVEREPVGAVPESSVVDMPAPPAIPPAPDHPTPASAAADSGRSMAEPVKPKRSRSKGAKG